MSCLGPVTLDLETERLRLTPFSLQDVDIAKSLLCDPAVMHFVSEPMSPDAVEDHMHNYVKRGAGGRVGIWCVNRKDTGQKLGDCVLLPVPIETDEYDWDSLKSTAYPNAPIEVGYLLIAEAWGRGYATEICRRMLQFAFEETALSQVVATTDPGHTRSQRVLSKCGLRFVGQRKAYGSETVDWFEINKADWQPK